MMYFDVMITEHKWQEMIVTVMASAADAGRPLGGTVTGTVRGTVHCTSNCTPIVRELLNMSPVFSAPLYLTIKDTAPTTSVFRVV